MSLHRNGRHKIAALPYQPPQPRAFGAEDERRRYGVVDGVVLGRAVSGKTNGPHASRFQFLHRPRDVDHLGDPHVRESTSRRLRGRTTQRRRSPRLKHHAINTGRIGCSQDRADIVRILDAIEHDDERSPVRAAHQLRDAVLGAFLDVGNDSLMNTAARLPLQDIPWNLTHGHTVVGRERDELAHPIIAPVPHAQLRDATGAKSFEHGIDPVDDHGAELWRMANRLV